MSYNKRIWANGDLITKEGMNNIEDGIYDAHDKIDAINNKVEENTNDTNTARQDISDIKTEIGTEELTTTSKKIKGAINELSSQIKETENLNELKYNVKNFGAVGDGVTDDTEHLQTAIDTIPEGSTLYLQNKTYIVTKTLIVKKAINIIGEGKKISFGSFSFNNGMTEIRKINGDENGDSVMFIDGSEKAINNIEISNIMFTASSSQNIETDDAILNANASLHNTSYGLKTSYVGESFFENIGVRQAKVAGLLASNGAVNSYKYCNACSNYVGFDISVFDSCIEHSWANHNITNGMAVKSNYFRVLNCRFEWNAKNGVYVSGGESTFVSNLFDRNGFAGLSFHNSWGHVVTGNYFSRNGCGGDGVTGRFEFSVPGHKSYIETPENECCHIKLNYMRDVTITGNRYRAGSDDTGRGVNSPCSIYCFSNAVNCKTVGNAGEYKAYGGHGGFTTHNLYEAKVIKKDDSSSPIFDYVKELPSEHSFSGINLQEISEFTVKLTSSHSEIDVWGIVFQNTLMSKIIVNVGSSANILKVIDYGGVTVNASFNDDKTELTVTLSQKCWTKYNIKSFV